MLADLKIMVSECYDVKKGNFEKGSSPWQLWLVQRSLSNTYK